MTVFPNRGAAISGSRNVRFRCYAGRDGLGADLTQPQSDGSDNPNTSRCRATLDSEGHMPILELEASGIIWAIKHLRRLFFQISLILYNDHRALQHLSKARKHKPGVQHGLKFLIAYLHAVEYRRGSASANEDFRRRLLQPATTDAECTCSFTLTDPADVATYLVRPSYTVLDALYSTIPNFQDFPPSGPRVSSSPDSPSLVFLTSNRTRFTQARRAASPGAEPSSSDLMSAPSTTLQQCAQPSTRLPLPCLRSSSLPPSSRVHG